MQDSTCHNLIRFVSVILLRRGVTLEKGAQVGKTAMVFASWRRSPLCITPNCARMMLFLGAPVVLLLGHCNMNLQV